jgi:hypothetical protein
MNWEEELKANIHLFNRVKRNWQPDEMALAYRIYNGYNGTVLIDTGCGSCRRSVLAHCVKIAKDFKSK